MKRVLISVYEKTGIVAFAKKLADKGYEIISTGGTHALLRNNNIEVTSIDKLTGFPEILGGRVKTLHPKVFGGILADKNNPKHSTEMVSHHILPFDIVVCNLYPFKETISKENVSVSEAIEQIDIGGVSLIRAAAKNYNSVDVLVDPSQYEKYLNGKLEKLELASAAFELIKEYDEEIESYFKKLTGLEAERSDSITLKNAMPLRYGENPHQKGILYKDKFDEIFDVMHGKELSYNNILDIDAAYKTICDFKDDKPTCVIIKHGNPCGVSTAAAASDAYEGALSTDTVSPFGGIIIFNSNIDFITAFEIDKLFTEIVLAPDFDDDALTLLMKKKNRRLIKFKFSEESFDIRKVSGGYLFQEPDNRIITKDDLNIVTAVKADDNIVNDMIFAFKVVKHTKSNAVVFVKNCKTLAIGGGQPSRIDSTKIAVSKAKQFNRDLKESIAASDAFFPFADGLLEIANTGAKAVVQPGGSVRDDEVIKAADEHGITMAFTGIRHFKH